MNKKAQQALNSFYKSVYSYIRYEYRHRYRSLIKSNKQQIIQILSPLYWGGENVPNASANVILFLNQKDIIK